MSTAIVLRGDIEILCRLFNRHYLQTHVRLKRCINTEQRIQQKINDNEIYNDVLIYYVLFDVIDLYRPMRVLLVISYSECIFSRSNCIYRNYFVHYK